MQLSPYNGLGIQYIFSKWLRWGYANDNLLALVTCDMFYVLFPQTYYFKSLDMFQVLFNLDVGGNQIPFLLFSNTITAETILCSTDKTDFESSPLPTNCKCESKPNQTSEIQERQTQNIEIPSLEFLSPAEERTSHRASSGFDRTPCCNECDGRATMYGKHVQLHTWPHTDIPHIWKWGNL